MTTIEQVKEFNDAMGIHTPSVPTIPSGKNIRLRIALLREEISELYCAFIDRDMVEILDALSDIQYVLDGTYLACGLHNLKDKAFSEVHRSNMSKLGDDGKPILSESGKVLKSKNYSKPDLKPFFEQNL